MTAPLRYRARAWLATRTAWLAIAAVLLVTSSALSAATAVRVELRVRAEQGERCTERTASRDEIRQAIEAGVDEVARYAELDPPDRDLVVARVRTRVREELPPPDC